MKKIYRHILRTISVIILAVIMFFAIGALAIRFGFTNVAGEEDNNSFAYNLIAKSEPVNSLPKNLSVYGEYENYNWCRLGAAAGVSQYDAAGMLKAYQKTKSKELLDHMILVLELRKGIQLPICTNDPGFWDEAN